MSANWKKRPSYLGSSSHHRVFIISMDSSVYGPRSENGTPSASISVSITPTPTPRATRPPDNWSSVAACFARRMGLWYGSTSTLVPRMTRLVWAAAYVSMVIGS